MNTDKFTNAGKAFQSPKARDFSAHDQALAQLRDIYSICKIGVSEFYKAAGTDNPDVYVERINERQINISYGFRPGRNQNSVLKGPLGIVLVTPAGKILLAPDLQWKVPNEPSKELFSIPLVSDNWQDAISDWLINFMTESERIYKVVSY